MISGEARESEAVRRLAAAIALDRHTRLRGLE